MINVMIVDDHELFRAGLMSLLQSIEDIRVICDAQNAEETLRLFKQHHPDVLVLDIELPDSDGFELTRTLVGMDPNVKILILSMHDQEEYALRLLRLGALGYIIKGASSGELPDAIRTVAKGKQYVTPMIREKLADMMIQAGSKGPLSLLTDRELQTITLIAQGKSIAEISDQLSLTYRTVETYYGRAKQKLNLRDSGSVVRFAIKNNLIKKL